MEQNIKQHEWRRKTTEISGIITMEPSNTTCLEVCCPGMWIQLTNVLLSWKYYMWPQLLIDSLHQPINCSMIAKFIFELLGWWKLFNENKSRTFSGSKGCQVKLCPSEILRLCLSLGSE